MRIGRYDLVQKLGSGSMGSVWRAADPEGRPLAIKAMHPHLADDQELRLRFRREFDVGSAVTHQSLVPMLEYNDAGESPYIVMRLIEGKNLRRLIEKGGPFYEWEAAEIGRQLASALAALHAAGVVHRDLKTSNVMVDQWLHATIIDYGIAKFGGDSTLTAAGGFMGTAEFAAPEPNFGRPLTAASDVYSLGIILYEALVGRVPFRSDRYTDTLRMHAQHPVPRVADARPMVSDALDSLISKMLQKRPEQRPTAEQVTVALRRIVEDLGHVAPGASAPASLPLPPVPNRQASYSPGPPNAGSPYGTEGKNRTSAALIAVVTGVLATAMVAGTIIVLAAQR